MTSIIQAVIIGMVVMIVGTIPRNVLFATNLRYHAEVPWAVPVVAVYLWCFWRYLGGAGPPDATREVRRQSLRANPLSGRLWRWALLAGGLGIVALVFGLRIMNRMVTLPQQQLPALSNVPPFTVWCLLIMAAPVAGVIEEASFRGYMQGPIERRYGLMAAILIVGTMFAIAHLDFTLILWPYYVAVAAIYGAVTYLTNSVWPSIALHTGGNVYSNIDLLLHGNAEWQASSGAVPLVWKTGADAAFLTSLAALLVIGAAAAWAYSRLAAVSQEAL